MPCKFCKVFTGVLVCVLIMTSYIYAAVPNYLNYQAVLFDESGNPVPDGETRLYIRILNSSMELVYEEEQVVDVVSGVVSVIIGEGGLLEKDMLVPDGPKYLEVQAEGYPSEDLMELVSVPYSIYSDIAKSVTEDAIGSEEVKDGSIKVVDLADEVLGGIEEKIVVKDDFESYVNSVSSYEGARQVGINPNFTYSAGDNVDTVIKDLDLAIKGRSDYLGSRVDSVDARLSSLTAHQIGAASLSDLDNYVLESDLPNFSTVEEINRGRLVVDGVWRFDEAFTSGECSFISGDDWQIICIADKTEVACGQPTACHNSLEIVPMFQLYSMPVSGSGARVPTSFDYWVEIINSGTRCYCQKGYTFGVGRIYNYPQGSSITWNIYSRSVDVQ